MLPNIFIIKQTSKI